MQTIWQAESDGFCRQVLKKHWPDIPCYEDVRDIDERTPTADVICGGFPCQPVSLAGARQGSDDKRWLWPEFARIVRILRPRFVLVENVPGLLSIERGRLFGALLAELAALGYDAEWNCLPAAAVGAPHLRWRVFLIAYANSDGQSERPVDADTRPGFVVPGGGGPMADAHSERQQEQRSAWSASTQTATTECSGDVADAEGVAGRAGLCEDGAWQETGWFSLAEPADGSWWAVEPDVGRVANGVSRRVDRLRSLGNAVVPQVAELVGRRIVQLAAGANKNEENT